MQTASEFTLFRSFRRKHVYYPKSNLVFDGHHPGRPGRLRRRRPHHRSKPGPYPDLADRSGRPDPHRPGRLADPIRHRHSRDKRHPRLTNTPLITDTLLPGAATASPFVISTATVAVTKSSTCDNAQFVSETYTDGSVISPGAVFVKTWTYKNLGPCTWNQDYKLIYGYAGDGTNWNTTPATFFPSLVVPGDKVDLSVTLTAPSTPGNYIAYFRLQNDNGFNFGDPPYLSITVK